MEPPRNVAQLDELLTRPTPETVAAAARLEEDVMVLGAGGKMGPSLASLVQRSIQAAGSRARVLAVSRYSQAGLAEELRQAGIEPISADLLDRAALDALPDCPNILYLAGMKFGASGNPSLTWAMNTLVPALVAERFASSRIVVLSTGNVYPLVEPSSGGATEETPPDPVGEYAWTCLGRERMFEHAAARGTRSAIIRLNYATDLRYGVLMDIGRKVQCGDPVDLTMGYVNTLWQGDANAVVFRALERCAAPPEVLNLTGPELLVVREVATRFGELLDREPIFSGVEGSRALLSNSSRVSSVFGPPAVSADTLIEWTARWLLDANPTLGKPTKFERADGRF
jgi:dTDP-4-dehydrorhamnose reductase